MSRDEGEPAEGKNTATVLIVDDNPTNLGVLFDYLDDHQFSVLVAEDGESALEQAEYAQPEIILLDVMMPGMDGFDTCQRLQENPATRDIPVIFMTALTDAADKVKSFHVGAVDYVTKPFQQEEILVRINNHLHTRRLQRELKARNAALESEVLRRKRMEETLQGHITQLEESNAELDAFARTVAHDLREPLTAIIGFAQLVLEHDGISPDLEESVRYILRTGYKMSDITRELLLLARVRDGQIEIEPLVMANIVSNSRDRLAYAIEESQAQVTVADEWPTALGYGPWIEEVWVNYLSNAIKYGGTPPRVELGAGAEQDGYVRFWVRDNGQGIADDHRDELFTEFTRLDDIRVQGHGLGLSIVRRIIEKLGGEVGFDSQPGEGSTFYFALPAP